MSGVDTEAGIPPWSTIFFVRIDKTYLSGCVNDMSQFVHLIFTSVQFLQSCKDVCIGTDMPMDN